MLLTLAGCGGHPKPPPPVDQALVQAAHSGRQALDYHHPAQAVTQYKTAFRLALARDEASDIGDLGYDLAVAQLATGNPAAALEAVSRTRLALRARSAPDFAELDLVQAASLHRLGRDDQADILAARAQHDATDQGTLVQASTLRGLIAAAHGDQAGLIAARAALGSPKHPSANWRENDDLLSAHLDLLRGAYGPAAASAQAAADIQRSRLDYAEMEQSLLLAARALRAGGEATDAARLYLRAGTSAAARGDTPEARKWLHQASLPGADVATLRAAAIELAAISPGHKPRPAGRAR